MSREKKPVVSYADVEHSDCDASDSEAQYAEQQQARGLPPVFARRRAAVRGAPHLGLSLV